MADLSKEPPLEPLSGVRLLCVVAESVDDLRFLVEAGDVVELVSLAGDVVARGVVGYDSAELPSLIGRKTHDLPEEQRREVVHADDLVPLHR